MRLISVLIGGQEYINQTLVAGSQRVRALNGEIGTASLAVISAAPSNGDGPEALPILNNQQIVITQEGGVRWFAGYVSRISRSLFTYNRIVYQIECQDYTLLLDRAIEEPALFTAQSNQAIIRALFSRYLPTIDTSNVIHLANISSASFDAGQSISSILQDIQEQVSGHFFLDYNLRFWYFGEGALIAPFNLDERASDEGWTGGGTLPGDGGLPGDGIIPGGGGEGGPQAYRWLREGMRYETDSSNAANRVTVRGEFSPDITDLKDAAITDSAHDGSATQERSTTWPPILGNPAAGNFYSSTALQAAASAQIYADAGLVYYRASVVYMDFDTSGIPDDAIIESASLFFTGILQNPDYYAGGIAQVGVEYVPPQNISGSLYTHEIGNNAYGYDIPIFTSLIGSTFGTTLLPLKNVNLISKTGRTAFRIGLKMPRAPQYLNTLTITMTEGATNAPGYGPPPRLHIGYRVLGIKIEVTLEDTAAIRAIASPTDDGVRHRFIINTAIHDSLTAAQRAQFELDQYARPKTSGELGLLREGLEPGEVIRIVSPSLNFDETYLIYRTTQTWHGDTNFLTLTSIEFGQFRPGFAMKFKQMERALREAGAL